jgi:hypothetical protein
MAASVHSGRCFCGDIQIEVSTQTLYCCICHCHSCQKASGGASVPWATFAKDGVRVTAGVLTWHHSSPGVTRGHCARCGTSMTYEQVDRKGQIDIALSVFDEPESFEPVAHIFVADKLPFVHIDDGLPRYSQNAGSTEV